MLLLLFTGLVIRPTSSFFSFVIVKIKCVNDLFINGRETRYCIKCSFGCFAAKPNKVKGKISTVILSK